MGRSTMKAWLLVGLLLATAGYVIAEEITLTTYYPSPRGVYQELRSTSSSYFATGGGNVGIGTDAPQATLDVNGGIRLGTVAACNAATEGTLRYAAKKLEVCDGANWVSAFGGGWEQIGDNIVNTNKGQVIIKSDLGLPAISNSDLNSKLPCQPQQVGTLQMQGAFVGGFPEAPLNLAPVICRNISPGGGNIPPVYEWSPLAWVEPPVTGDSPPPPQSD
ncbi:MAG: hypothetical protein HY737_00105 [Candidatus Omnitrophica bacterium]|nr:hypothetical protein [Candidatus Omnitrophota bacterium]